MDLFDATARPATPKQVQYARAIAARSGARLTPETLADRKALSAWIDAHKGAQSRQPSSKQVAFAERIARLKRRDVPEECFRDKDLMSRWIDRHKP